MKLQNRLTAMVTCAVLATATATTGSYSQTTKAAPAYVVLEFTVKDPDGFRDYAQRSPATVTQHGGRFLVRPGKIMGVTGEAPKGPFAVLGFESVEQAQKWASSPEYSALVPMRDKSADTRMFIVEGVSP
jgi:uncharacterized protein (DUF1330 family)